MHIHTQSADSPNSKLKSIFTQRVGVGRKGRGPDSAYHKLCSALNIILVNLLYVIYVKKKEEEKKK